jgi:hypothetical protein
MRRFTVAVCSLVAGAALMTGDATAQTAHAMPPTLIPVSGQLTTSTGQPRTGSAVLVLSLYDARDDAAPRWIEHQVVTLDSNGRYDVQFGSTFDGGIPPDVFTNAPTVRWLGVGIENEAEQPRVMLVSVPFAARAANADALSGKPATDFVLSANLADQVRTALRSDPSTEGDDPIFAANTVDFLQKATGVGAGITDSIIIEVAGKIGVGTTTPGKTFHVAGVDHVSQFESTNAGAPSVLRVIARNDAQSRFDFGDNDSPTTGRIAYSHLTNAFSFFTSDTFRASLTNAGDFGVGTGSPDGRLHAYSASGGAKVTITAADGIGDAWVNLETNNNEWSFGIDKDDSHKFKLGNSGTLGSNDLLTVTTAGNLGVGTASPTAKLHVVGNTTITGNVTVDGNIAAKYQDVAEWVDAVEPLEAGTIVVIDSSATNRVMASASSYDSRVAGAVSAQPGLLLGEPGEGKVLVAQSGRVRVRADARYGAIRAGDLLVTSPTKGHVMRSRPIQMAGQPVHRPGTLIGKALEPLSKGQGDILVLLTLQ